MKRVRGKEQKKRKNTHWTKRSENRKRTRGEKGSTGSKGEEEEETKGRELIEQKGVKRVMKKTHCDKKT